MATIIQLAWHDGAAALLILAGLGLVARGVRRDAAGVCRPVSDPYKAWSMVRCFRTVIIGLALVAIGLSWMLDLEALLGIALIIGIGEMLETSTVLAACRARALPRRRRTFPRIGASFGSAGSRRIAATPGGRGATESARSVP